MQAVFEKRYHLRIGDFDASRHLRPSTVLDLFQCVAAEHAEELGIGLDRMLEQELIWVLVRVRYEIERPITYGTERLHVKTWPLAPRRSGFQREYRVTDAAGNLLIRGTSDWVLMHRVRRRLMPVGDIYPKDIEYLTDQSFEGRVSPIPDTRTEEPPVPFMLRYSDLDMNGHVNNTRYTEFALSAFPPESGRYVRGLQLDFHREVLADSPLLLTCLRDGDIRTVTGRNGEGERMFSAMITLS
jgi:acyl-CoA thioesterase FadM